MKGKMENFNVGPAPSVPDGMDEAEWKVRVDLAACYRLVAQQGWDELLYTHISARVPGPERHFLIIPFGLLFEEVTASQLVKIDLAGRAIGNQQKLINRAGFTIHSALHQAREDAHCVIHLHTLDGIAVASLAKGLEPTNQLAASIYQDVAYHDYGGVVLDADESQRMVRDLGDKSMLILRNHGSLALGQTMGEAFTRIYALERACSLQVRIHALTRANEIHWPSPAAIEKTAAISRDVAAWQKMVRNILWPALLRKLDRTDPSYAR